MKIAICGIRHESNSFSTLTTKLDDFRITRGEEILQDSFWSSYPDVEWKPILIGRAGPHGLVDKGAYISMRDEIIEGLEQNLPVDGVYLSLHGAMDVVDVGDGESDLITHIRKVVGDDIPITGSLDLHANVSPILADSTSALTAYRTSPHIDGAETRKRAVDHLINILSTGKHTRNVLIKLPLLLPGEYAVTEVEPAKSLYTKLFDIEKRPGIVDASILIGCAWTDSEYTSVSVIVVGEEDSQEADACAVELAQDIWSKRHEFKAEVETVSVEEAVTKAMNSEIYPVVISDSGDNVTAGGAGDTPIMLDELLKAHAEDAVIAGITDPEAVDKCVESGTNSVIKLNLGGKLDTSNGYKKQITGIVGNVVPSCMAVVAMNGIKVIITSDRRAFTDTQGYKQVGVDPLKEEIIVVKVGLLHGKIRDIAKKPIMAMSPGFTSLLLDELPYKRLKRPIFPLDDLSQFNV
ncbi:hypothetical protein GF312_11195 [Candidatus Poribacteria bacterium]|nr:hypothetical protein [Candidatus Poribacteria bacterium]